MGIVAYFELVCQCDSIVWRTSILLHCNRCKILQLKFKISKCATAIAVWEVHTAFCSMATV